MAFSGKCGGTATAFGLVFRALNFGVAVVERV
jgi:hypothetical protein